MPHARLEHLQVVSFGKSHSWYNSIHSCLADDELLGRLRVFLGISSISMCISMWAFVFHMSTCAGHVPDVCVTCNSSHLPTQFPQNMLQNSNVLVWPLQVRKPTCSGPSNPNPCLLITLARSILFHNKRVYTMNRKPECLSVQ